MGHFLLRPCFPGTTFIPPLNSWNYCSCFLPDQSRLQADKKVSDLSPKAAKGFVHLGWEASLRADKPESLWRLGLLQGEKQLLSRHSELEASGRVVNKATGV